MRIFLSILFILISLDAKNIQKVSLQLQWKNQFEFAGFYAAKEKGFYALEGLDVEFKEFESGMNITNEVVGHRVDYATSSSSVILDYLNAEPIVLLANFFKQSPLVLLTQEDIKTPWDLKGKNVMGLVDSVHNTTLLSMLDKFNVKQSDFKNIPRNFAIDSFVKKEVDAISVFNTNEVYEVSKLGIKYNILNPAAFGINFYDINLFTSKAELENNPKRVEAFRRASIKGWEYALKNHNEIVDLILKKYNTQNKSKDALLFEAKQIEYMMLANVYPVGSVDVQMIKNIANGYKQAKFTQAVTYDNLDEFVYSPHDTSLILSNEQKQYLEKKKKIKMCVDPNWMPFEAIEDGEHTGIASDYIKLISKKINTPIELVKTSTWTQSLQKMKKEECDILSLVAATPSRKRYIDFTQPYIKVPLVVATLNGVPFIDDLSKIKDKKLGVVANYSIVELLKKKYPKIELVEYSSVQEGLEAVRIEKVFGFLDNSLVLNHEIQKNKLKNISITGQFKDFFYLSVGTRKDQPVLQEIMQKAVLSIDKHNVKSIVQKWNNITYELQTDYRLTLTIVFVGFVLIILFMYWNLKLKEEINKKELAQEKLRQSEEKFRILFDKAPVLLDAFDENGSVVLWNQECERVFGWSLEELQKQDNALALFYPDVDQRQKVIESFKSGKYNVYEEWSPITKDKKVLSTMWANVKLPSGEVYSIGYDITQQREDERIIKEKTKQLEYAKKELEDLNNSLEKRVEDEIQKNTQHQVMLMQQSKLAQMGEMIENIAHQWRQPLAQINSCVLMIEGNALKQKKDIDKTVADQLNEIEDLTSYMSKTIDDFQNFFHPQKEKNEFYLKDAVDDVYKILKGALNTAQIKVQNNFDTNIKLFTHKKELEHVILVIINNAKDALIHNNIQNSEITIDAQESDESLKITICDKAGGIKVQPIEKVFEPYYTTKHKSQGTGIGLYMSKMIVDEGLGGKLLASNIDDGACFYIEIPKGDLDG